MGLMDRTGDGSERSSGGHADEDTDQTGGDGNTDQAGDGERPDPGRGQPPAPSTGDDDPATAVRIEELERRVDEYERLIDDIADRHRGPRGDGPRRRRCVECDDGWIIEADRRLICDTCGYLAYL